MDTNEIKKYAVIGDPIEQSRSPELYSPMFSKFGIEAEFMRILVTSEEISKIRAIANDEKLCGFAVTMPHKKTIMPYLNELSNDAKAIGAVNIVRIENSRFIGFNTDGLGLVNALKEAGVEPKGLSAAILGNGGAASAAKFALDGEGCIVQIISRKRAKTGRAYPIEDAIFEFEVASSLISNVDIVINATPLGMKDGAIFGDLSFVSLLKPSCVVCDMVYRSDRDTPLIKAAKFRCLTAVAGDRMLYHQGVLAFRLWTGLDYSE